MCGVGVSIWVGAAWLSLSLGGPHTRTRALRSWWQVWGPCQRQWGKHTGLEELDPCWGQLCCASPLLGARGQLLLGAPGTHCTAECVDSKLRAQRNNLLPRFLQNVPSIESSANPGSDLPLSEKFRERAPPATAGRNVMSPLVLPSSQLLEFSHRRLWPIL